jgi:hypothetical protein
MGDTLSSNHIENRENGEELTISEELQNLKDEILTSSKIEPESPI